MRLALDLVYNFRLLRKHMGFVAICVLMISSGIGLSITMYSISDTESAQLVSWIPLAFTLVSVGIGLQVLFGTYSPTRVLATMEPGETLRDE